MVVRNITLGTALKINHVWSKNCIQDSKFKSWMNIMIANRKKLWAVLRF